MNEQVAANPLGTERVGKLMVRYAIPSIISIVVNSLYNMVDQIFIGQGAGYLGNAATNIILPLTSIPSSFFLSIREKSCFHFPSTFTRLSYSQRR